MRLTDLQPEYLKILSENTYKHVDVLREEADGIWFLCPKCFNEEPVGAAGTHGIICWRPHVPQTMSPAPGRWELVGADFSTLSLVGQPTSSVKLLAGCNAHFTVSNGEIIWNE